MTDEQAAEHMHLCIIYSPKYRLIKSIWSQNYNSVTVGVVAVLNNFFQKNELVVLKRHKAKC